MPGFRILVLETTDGLIPAYKKLPWIAICQDRFPPILPGDDGFLPPMWGATKQEALDAIDLTISERLTAMKCKSYRFIG